jgi:hypothetical protein
MPQEVIVQPEATRAGAATGSGLQAGKIGREVIVQGDGSRTQGKIDLTEPRIFVVRDGKRHPILDFRSFRDAGYDPSDVQIISDAELEKLPLVKPKLGPGEQIVLDLNTFLGSGHYMTTWGVMRKTESGAHVDATTRTRTITMFGGFRGGVNMVYSDANGFPVGMSDTQTYGVDGTWIGRSDRTDYWSQDLPGDWANRTTALTILHFWNPWTLQDQVRKLVDAAKPIVEIVAAIAAIGGGGKTGTK